MVDRPDPSGFNNIFKSKHTSEHKTKEGGEYSGKRYDSGKVHFLCEIQDRTADKEQQSLTDIPEHGAEDKAVHDTDKNGRIHFTALGKSVHLDEHFKWFEKLWILKLGRRFSKILFPVLFYYDINFVVSLSLFDKCIGIFFRHPAAENIVFFLLVCLGSCRKFTDIEVIGKTFQLDSCTEQPRSILTEHFLTFIFH